MQASVQLQSLNICLFRTMISDNAVNKCSTPKTKIKSLNMKTKNLNIQQSKLSFYDKRKSVPNISAFMRKRRKKYFKRIQSFSHCSLEDDVLLFVASLYDGAEPPPPPPAVPKPPGTIVLGLFMLLYPTTGFMLFNENI